MWGLGMHWCDTVIHLHETVKVARCAQVYLGLGMFVDMCWSMAAWLGHAPTPAARHTMPHGSLDGVSVQKHLESKGVSFQHCVVV